MGLFWKSKAQKEREWQQKVEQARREADEKTEKKFKPELDKADKVFAKIEQMNPKYRVDIKPNGAKDVNGTAGEYRIHWHQGYSHRAGEKHIYTAGVIVWDKDNIRVASCVYENSEKQWYCYRYVDEYLDKLIESIKQAESQKHRERWLKEAPKREAEKAEKDKAVNRFWNE